MKYFLLLLLSIQFVCNNDQAHLKVWYNQIKEDTFVFNTQFHFNVVTDDSFIPKSQLIENKVISPMITQICDSNCNICSKNQCSKCKKGYFLDESTCYQACPNDKYADIYSFTCKNIIYSPIYLKAYTTSRCLNSCGREFSECR